MYDLVLFVVLGIFWEFWKIFFGDKGNDRVRYILIDAKKKKKILVKVKQDQYKENIKQVYYRYIWECEDKVGILKLLEEQLFGNYRNSI